MFRGLDGNGHTSFSPPYCFFFSFSLSLFLFLACGFYFSFFVLACGFYFSFFVLAHGSRSLQRLFVKLRRPPFRRRPQSATLYSTLYILHYIFDTLYSTLYIRYFIFDAVYHIRCLMFAIHSVLCFTVYNLNSMFDV